MQVINFFPLVSFLLLLVLLIGKTAILKKKGIRVGVKPENKPQYKYIIYPIFFIILLVWGVVLIRCTFRLPFYFLPQIITAALVGFRFLPVIGALVLLLFLMFITFTLLHFKESMRFGMDPDNRGKLITKGIFSVSRNPFFVSIELYFVGTALVFFTPFFIVVALLALFSIHFFILKEEKFLLQNYGDEYRNYTKEVRRYF